MKKKIIRTKKAKTGIKLNKAHLLEGAVVGAVLGVLAGVLLDPSIGKGARAKMKKHFAEFSHFIAPQIKRLKQIGESEYNALIAEEVKRFAKVNKLSMADERVLAIEAKRPWKHIKKHLK